MTCDTLRYLAIPRGTNPAKPAKPRETSRKTKPVDIRDTPRYLRDTFANPLAKPVRNCAKPARNLTVGTVCTGYPRQER